MVIILLFLYAELYFLFFYLFKLQFRCNAVTDFVIKKLEQKKSPLDFNKMKQGTSCFAWVFFIDFLTNF